MIWRVSLDQIILVLIGGDYLAKSKGVCREMKSEGKLAANSGLTNRNFI